MPIPDLNSYIDQLPGYYGGIARDFLGSPNYSVASLRDLLVSLVPEWAYELYDVSPLVQNDPAYPQVPPGVMIPTGPSTVGVPNVATVNVSALTRRGKTCVTYCDPATGKRVRVSSVTGKICPTRHMNPLNPKALTRSMRRMSGFQHFAKKFDSLISRDLKPIHRRAPSRGGRCTTCKRSPCGC